MYVLDVCSGASAGSVDPDITSSQIGRHRRRKAGIAKILQILLKQSLNVNGLAINQCITAFVSTLSVASAAIDS